MPVKFNLVYIDTKKNIAEYQGNYIYSFGEKEKLNRGGWNHFLPSPSCLMLWMKEASFIHNIRQLGDGKK